ncbi:MAG: leucine--tRNA ligase [Candidatus Altiarchaeales archaeon]|nr:leucine--tRNA ligase [Candidatus Altiarchaeales archaeon]MBD3416033.1 leucine--tRNA ligase [Candidatus Altiarchaeales archaeon]
MSDSAEIEAKWLKRWEEAGAFESDPDSRDSFYLTVAYPYPSGGMHIGHARTYTVPDVIARYKRMQGYNVLFPMAWHVTGTPIIGALNRLKEGEEKQLKVLREVYGMSDEELNSIKEPLDFARYFIDSHYRPSMRKLGYTIDWRRQFTTNDPHYNAFITWQYMTLKDRGLIKKGLHPVKFCTKDENPVTTHDLLEGAEADTQEFTLLKFEHDGSYIIAATLRPETMWGQTNMWVNPAVTYVKADVDGEEWIISRQCAGKLKLQDRGVEVKGEVKGGDLLGKYCKAPVIDRDIIILPSDFPDPDIGTGLVTSVPSDAPYDWIALKDLQGDRATCEKHGLDYDVVKAIETIPIIDIEGFGPEAAKDMVERMAIRSQHDTEKLEEATKEVYKQGFHAGFMNENCGPYKGMAVVRAKEKMKQALLGEGRADTMLEFSEPVICRCGGRVVVAKAESWFIDYANEDWKEQVCGCIYNLNTIPDRTKQDYMNTVDWLREWPCIRNYGLGTKLPFDDRFMIEPLSDSTIYMAYYTISHLLEELEPEQLTREFFDYIFRGEGKPGEISNNLNIPLNNLKKIRDSFDYWYPQAWRCSALELIQNHLTFMLFHHCALFNADKWPLGIASFGMGLLEGEKMSSSKGNVILVKEAVEKHGADVTRLFLMGNAEPWQDFDWRENLVEATMKRLNQFKKLVLDSHSLEGKSEIRPIDRWMMSRLNRRIMEAVESLEAFQTRKALQSMFYEMFNDISWYQRRRDPNPEVMRELANAWVRLLTPFTPFTCEELWENIGGEGFVSQAEYPTADESKLDERSEASEEYLRSLMEDVQNILNVTKKSPSKISLYTSPRWKYTVFNAIVEGRQIKDVMADPEVKRNGKQAAKLMQTRRDEIPHVLLSPEDESAVLGYAYQFLSREFKAEVSINPESDPEGKAKFAQPMKPGIFIE